MELELLVKCDCGWETRGTENSVVAATSEHAKEVHGRDLTHDQVMGMARPASAGFL